MVGKTIGGRPHGEGNCVRQCEGGETAGGGGEGGVAVLVAFTCAIQTAVKAMYLSTMSTVGFEFA